MAGFASGWLKRTSAELCKQTGLDELKRTQINTRLETGVGHCPDSHGTAHFTTSGRRYFANNLESFARADFISTGESRLSGQRIHVSQVPDDALRSGDQYASGPSAGSHGERCADG
jgi:hypothetical protein